MDSAQPLTPRHVPVLLEECVRLLAPALREPGSVCVDGTLGLGGHAEAILRECPDVHLIGIDRDPQALALAGERLAPFGARFTAVRATYDEIPEVLATHAQGQADGILLDLGVSSMQLDDDERGFSYARDTPLDMRMDPTGGMTAADILNTYSADELARVLRDWGEERYAPRIARAIVARRASQQWATSGELVELVRSVIPLRSQHTTTGNPAKRTFQALRIEVNDELPILQRAVARAIESLAVGGRLVVMSYHSLEDRIVKQAFSAGTQSATPPGVPAELPGYEPYLRAVVRGALKANESQIAANPRAASVRLRAVERTRPTPVHRRRSL